MTEVSGTEVGIVQVIDTATNSSNTTVPVGIFPIGVAVTPDGRKIYVTNGSLGVPANMTVSVIDAATATVTATIPVEGFFNPYAVAITPDGAKVYVTSGDGLS